MLEDDPHLPDFLCGDTSNAVPLGFLASQEVGIADEEVGYSRSFRGNGVCVDESMDLTPSIMVPLSTPSPSWSRCPAALAFQGVR